MKGLSAAHITGESTKEMIDGVLRGDYQLVYITPARITDHCCYLEENVGWGSLQRTPDSLCC